MADDLIFHDPSGRRSRWVRLASGLLIALLLLVGAGFFATLAFAPRLPGVTLKDPHVLRALHVETAHKLKGHHAWTAIPHPKNLDKGGPARPLAIGFYVSWDETSRSSLKSHVDQLDVVSPQWVGLTAAGRLDVTKDPEARAIIAASKTRPSLMPGVYNAKDGVWNGPAADKVLTNPAARKAMLDQLVALAKSEGFSGYVFDFENLSPAGVAAYPGFIAQARAALKPIGREVWVTAPFADDSWPLKKLQAAADALVLMAYDQHWGTGDAGPPAGQDWFQRQLTDRMGLLDPSRTIVALGAYGYDWTLPAKGQKGSANAVTYTEATQIAHDSGATPAMDAASLNPMFAYEDDTGRRHEVWFLDAVTLHNQLHVADGFRPMGYALWRMGGEDPLSWTLMRHQYGALRPDGLSALAPGQDVDFDGTGEVLAVTNEPRAGHRTLQIDAASGLVTAETYDVMPTSYVIQRYGARPGLVALTFDDGPDRRWTPKILDILKAKHAPATFFVIGKNMSENPDLVAREVDEGHNVGNHTWTHPNIGEVPVAETSVELSATQRLFETITGRSMRLFRPPYFGDAEPSTPQEVAPLLDGQAQGYVTVGLRIDPDDWKKPEPQHIIDTTISRLADTVRPGQIVLLHDSGGDRSRTVQALPALIDAIRAHGYRLVTVGELAGMTPAQAMPAADRSSLELTLDRIGFGFLRFADDALRILFITAIVLGVARLGFLAVLAVVHSVRLKPPPMPDPTTGPLVSVLIPCFNEEKVIEASVRRILASHWTNIEVLVLDDGSRDATSQIVGAAFAGEPRVTLMTFENGGKARALNRGLVQARGDIVVALDADTLFPPDTLAQLVRWFGDPAVGAVAGNAIVGNRSNLITRWQALEYVTAQNLERRALAALGAVTVVPGAVGAWRRSALTELGGYPADTLAEDQDLTLAIQRAGWKVQFDPEARAYTEAPDTVGGLLKQRFRWSFGTLQCIWKHRSALFSLKRPVLGFIALPQIWLFQILLTAIAPLVDLAVIWGMVSAVYAFAFHPVEWSPDDLTRSLSYWAAFVMLDLSAGAIGMALERRAPWSDLIWLPVQRFGYRQLMYYVVLKSIDAAMHGALVGWGKLERRATATVGKTG
ncbi:MAG: glycosyltransferase [Alphaproteobacteria bacterium]|nr:glycosyltransferase [Alphaproteobacteria bacterium]MBU1514233.1 glycosyltransferase [Alphaproteobacteria bacterium]MBU2093321.1 glycosyltransferase [Alphaproteobacteria bacterium]MBU2153412.1 glycosyltransferase [Alphaproteobacteria bacterium]MBU2307103.1 glycosyltransferase [Alphaproteobacteria bacterium]